MEDTIVLSVDSTLTEARELKLVLESLMHRFRKVCSSCPVTINLYHMSKPSRLLQWLDCDYLSSEEKNLRKHNSNLKQMCLLWHKSGSHVTLSISTLVLSPVLAFYSCPQRCRVLEVNAQGYNTMYTHLSKFNLFWQHFLKAAAEYTLLEKASEIPTVKENELKVYVNQQNREVTIISRKHIIFQSDNFVQFW